jgi:hypothetical protein
MIMIQERIGAPAPSVTRQPVLSAANKPAVRNERIQTTRNGGLMPAGKIAALLLLYGVQALPPPPRGDQHDRRCPT